MPTNCKKTLARQSGVQDVRDKHRQLTASRRLFGPGHWQPATPTPPATTPPTEVTRTASFESFNVTPPADPGRRIPPRVASLAPMQRVVLAKSENADQESYGADPDNNSMEVRSSQMETFTGGATGQSPQAKKLNKRASKTKLSLEESFDALRVNEKISTQLTQKELQIRVRPRSQDIETNISLIQHGRLR